MKTSLKYIAKTAWQCIRTTRVYARSKTTFSKLRWRKSLCAFFRAGRAAYAERAWDAQLVRTMPQRCAGITEALMEEMGKRSIDKLFYPWAISPILNMAYMQRFTFAWLRSLLKFCASPQAGVFSMWPVTGCLVLLMSRRYVSSRSHILFGKLCVKTVECKSHTSGLWLQSLVIKKRPMNHHQPWFNNALLRCLRARPLIPLWGNPIFSSTLL